MTVHLVTFSDESMSRAAQLCKDSATRNGVDYTGYWSWSDAARRQGKLIDLGIKGSAFYRENKGLLDQPRGFGFWAWKSYIIGRQMENACADGDILIYADAGVEFINNVNYIIDRMGHEKPQDDVWLFGNNWEHAHWCKRDAINAVWPMDFVTALDQAVAETEAERHAHVWKRFGKQVQASVIFFRVSDFSRQFVAEWLKWCLFEGGRLIDDSPSRLPNHPEFQEHRHDQAILTTLAYREVIKLHWWPAIYNDGQFTYEKLPEYAGDTYPAIFHHHRRRNHEWARCA